MEKIVYDAFISYSHSEPDAFVAAKLHTMLEHYRISRKLQKISGKKKIDRVFRDREELPLSADLASNIREALENSEFLIVICSPRSLRSEWVQREIETFLETHEKDNVLTVLVEGEPEEAFPEILSYKEEKIIRENGEEEVVRIKNEPMAADVRGKNRKEMGKKLKNEFLRILAPMLSCTYDTLKQRHRDYMFRRILAGVGAAAVLALLFMGYAFRQAAAIDERYQEARRNQARYLAKISGDLLDSGDRKGALKTALAITPKDGEEEKPVVPEQMYALNRALYSYHHTNKISFVPDTAYELDGQTTYQEEGILSPEETAYFCRDQLGNAYILSTESGECIWKICPKDIPDLEDGKFIWFAPLSEEKAVLLSDHTIIYLDWKEKKVLNMLRDEQGESFYNSEKAYAVLDPYIGITNGTYVWVYDLENGKCIQKVRYSDEEYASYSVYALSFQEDGKALAIATAVDYHDTVPKGLLLLSVEDGSMRMLSKEETQETAFIGEHTVAAIHYQYVKERDLMVDAPERNFFVSVYDSRSGKSLWSSEMYQIQAFEVPCGIAGESMQVNGKEQEVLVASLKDRLLIMQPENGEIIEEKRYSEDIVGVSKYDSKRMLAGLADGGIRIVTFDYFPEMELGSISAEVGSFIFSRAENVVIATIQDNRKVVFERQLKDENMTPLSMEEEILKVEYHTLITDTGDSEVYRSVFYDLWGRGGFNYTGLSVYRTCSEKKLFEYKSADQDESIYFICVQNIRGIPHIVCKKKDEIIIANLETGEITSSQKLEEDDEWRNADYAWFHTSEKVVLCNSDMFSIAEFSEIGIEFPEPEPENALAGYSENVQVSADDRYVIFIVSTDNGYGLQVWNIEEEAWVKIEGKRLFPIKDYSSYSIGQERNVAAVYTEEGTIAVLDWEEGKVIQSFQAGYFENMELAFLNHDNYLISYGDSHYLTLWDNESGEIRMKEEIDDPVDAHLFTEGSKNYFGLEFNGYAMSDDYFLTDQTSLYYVDEEGRFYPYADIPGGHVSIAAEEIFIENSGGYYGSFYGYQELKTHAEEVLEGEVLSDAEKKSYFVSE